jgi:predicted RNA polymerase sigma factor
VTTRPWDTTSEHLLRELAPQVLGAVIRRFHDFDSAEDAVQEAMIAAVTQWPQGGIPENPRGWLIQVALRRMTDYVRSEVARRKERPQWRWRWKRSPSGRLAPH